MKKLAILLVLVSLLQARTFAQDTPLNFRLGLTAYPVISWMKAESNSIEGSRIGYAYGVIGDFDFAPNYSISTGLTLTSISGNSTFLYNKGFDPSMVGMLPGATVPMEMVYRVQYISIPVSLKLRTAEAPVRGYGQFGLEGGIKTSARGINKMNNTSFNAAEVTRAFRGALLIGAGAELKAGASTSVLLGLSFSNSFTSIASNSGQNQKLHYLGLNFAVIF